MAAQSQCAGEYVLACCMTMVPSVSSYGVCVIFMPTANTLISRGDLRRCLEHHFAGFIMINELKQYNIYSFLIKKRWKNKEKQHYGYQPLKEGKVIDYDDFQQNKGLKNRFLEN